jgi:hypothetical protein
MVKKFLILTLITILSAFYSLPSVFAEQPAAEQYRQMFKSGNFYVEFQNSILAGKDGARVFRENVNDKNPTVFYRDGKYYSFLSMSKNPTENRDRRKVNRLLILPEENLYSPFLDPNEHWRNTINRLALPEVFVIFCENDSYRDKNFDWAKKPTYESSSTKKIGQQIYECDRYINEIKNAAGKVIAREVYTAFYEEGKLVTIEKHFIRSGVIDYIVSKINIKTITAEIPDSAFAINEKTKIYKAHNGDLNDLLETYEEVGEIGGDQK